MGYKLDMTPYGNYPGRSIAVTVFGSLPKDGLEQVIANGSVDVRVPENSEHAGYRHIDDCIKQGRYVDLIIGVEKIRLSPFKNNHHVKQQVKRLLAEMYIQVSAKKAAGIAQLLREGRGGRYNRSKIRFH